MSIDIRQIDKMSRAEKVAMIEALWSDLAKDPSRIESPQWHNDELEATEKRVKAGEERLVDWADAKRTLREKWCRGGDLNPHGVATAGF